MKKNKIYLFVFFLFAVSLFPVKNLAAESTGAGKNVTSVEDSLTVEKEKTAQQTSPEVVKEKNTVIKTSDFCSAEFSENNICPETVCSLKCFSMDEKGKCEDICVPKQCIDIKSDNCPTDICQILKGCDESNICYPRETFGSSQCGNLAYAGDEVECCEGFVKRCGIEFFDGTCDMEGSGSLDSVPICLPCGNGICNQFENRCNCPEDCNNSEGMIELLKAIKARGTKTSATE